MYFDLNKYNYKDKQVLLLFFKPLLRGVKSFRRTAKRVALFVVIMLFLGASLGYNCGNIVIAMLCVSQSSLKSHSVECPIRPYIDISSLRLT